MMNKQISSSTAPPDSNLRLGIRMHGVTLALEANHPPLLAYAAEHLRGFVETPVATPDLLVQLQWSEGEWDPETNPFPTDGALNIIGKRMLGNARELIWLDTLRMKGLQLRFRRENGKFIFEVAYRFHPKKEKIENLPDYQYKKYFSLMSYLVYYPLLWYLETFRSWTVLHASALSSAYGGIMIGGLGGVGKTTTCVALMQHEGIRLLAENLIFTDGELIYPCCEPIRLDERSLAMLGEHPGGLLRMRFPEGLKEKWLFHLPMDALSQKVRPAMLFLPQFTRWRYCRKLASSIAIEKIMAMNRLTRELDDYGWYAAALNMHWPTTGLAEQRVKVLRQFTAGISSFELGVDRSAGVEAVVEDVLNAVHSLAYML